MAADPSSLAHNRRYYEMIERSVDVALAAAPVPLRVLVVDCGTGEILRELLERVPYGTEFVGVDQSAQAVRVAHEQFIGRLAFVCGRAEALPFPDHHFDLVLSTLGHERWSDPAVVLHQLARVLARTGSLVVIDAGSPKRMTSLIEQTGLLLDRRETVHRRARVLPRVHAYVAGA